MKKYKIDLEDVFYSINDKDLKKAESSEFEKELLKNVPFSGNDKLPVGLSPISIWYVTNVKDGFYGFGDEPSLIGDAYDLVTEAYAQYNFYDEKSLCHKNSTVKGHYLHQKESVYDFVECEKLEDLNIENFSFLKGQKGVIELAFNEIKLKNLKGTLMVADLVEFERIFNSQLQKAYDKMYEKFKENSELEA